MMAPIGDVWALAWDSHDRNDGEDRLQVNLEEAGLALADPSAYADEARYHEACTLLRAHSPVHLVEAPGYRPFWAITKHSDIMETECISRLFLTAPCLLPMAAAAEAPIVATGYGVHPPRL